MFYTVGSNSAINFARLLADFYFIRHFEKISAIFKHIKIYVQKIIKQYNCILNCDLNGNKNIFKEIGLQQPLCINNK